MKMKHAAAFLVSLVIGLLLGVAGTAIADAWPYNQPTYFPQAHVMSPASPSCQTTGAAGEVHWTASATGLCFAVDASVDTKFLVSASGAPATANSTTGNNLYSKTIRLICAKRTKDYVSAYLSAAGTACLSELDAP